MVGCLVCQACIFATRYLDDARQPCADALDIIKDQGGYKNDRAEIGELLHSLR